MVHPCEVYSCLSSVCDTTAAVHHWQRAAVACLGAWGETGACVRVIAQAARDFIASSFWATRLTHADSFEAPVMNASLWQSSSLVISKACGSAHGTFSTRFFGRSNADRFLATVPLDITHGGQWQFFLKYANDDGDGCEAVQSSLVSFQYSKSGGPWVTIGAPFPRKTFM